MISDRIAAARRAAGLSTRELAERAGVSAMSISKYENGKATPSSAVLLRMADALEVKVDYFFRKKAVDLQELEFRKHPRLPKMLQRRIQANAKDQVERFLELLDRFPSAPVNTFAVPRISPRRIEGLDQLEDVAAQVRRGWNLGLNPVPDLTDTFEELGIRVFQTDLAGDNEFAGLAARVDGMPVVVISAAHPGDRQRFTLAHELGHIVLANLELAQDLNPEKVANRFAGAFLVPRDEVLEKLGRKRNWLEPRELWNLKMEYGLSMGGWVHRARDLGVISYHKYREIWKLFQDMGWDKEEPFDQFPPEKPRLTETLVLRALSEELVGESKAAELLGRTVRDFRKWRLAGRADARHQ